MQETRRRRAEERIAETPDWQRNIEAGLDPRNILSGFLNVPNLPSAIAGIAGYPETAADLRVSTTGDIADALRAGVLERHGIEEPISITPEGELDVDLQSLLLQEGPLALLPLGNVSRLAAGAGRGARIAAGAGEVALNLAVPGVQGPYALGAPVSVGATVGIPSGLALATGGGATIGEGDEAPAPPSGLTLGQSPVTRVTPPPSITLGQTRSVPPPSLSLNDSLEGDTGDPSRMTAWIAAGLSAAAILGGSSAAVRAATNRNRLARQQAHAELTGTAVPRPDTNLGQPSPTMVPRLTGDSTDAATALQTQLLDPNAPLFTALRRSGIDDEAYDTFRARIDTSANPIAMNARIRDAVITGSLPHSQVRMPALADHLNNLSRFTPEELARYDDTLAAMTRMDDLRANNQTVWGSGSRAQTLTQLDATVQATRIDAPEVWEAVNEVHEMYRRLGDYMVEAGYISQQRRDLWTQQRPNYAPLQLMMERTSGIEDRIERFIGGITGREPQDVTGGRFLEARATDLAEEGVMPGNVESIARNHTAYFGRLVRDVEQNRLRRQFIDTVEGSLVGPSGNRVIQRVDARGRDTVSIFRGGEEVHYRITDPGIRTTLEFNTPAVIPVMNGARRLMQNFTTGVFAPLFATKSAVYDALTGFLTAPRGRHSSRLLISPVSGTIRGIRDLINRSAAQTLDLSLRNNGPLSRMLGVGRTVVLRDRMREAYANSATRLFDQLGGASSTILDDINPDTISSMLTQIAPDYVRRMSGNTWEQVKANTFVRMYTGLLSAIHNSARVEFIAQNMRRLQDEADAIRLGGQARNLSGDMTRVVGARGTRTGTAIQGVLSTIPYATQSIQGIYHLARTIGNRRQLPQLITRTMGFGAAATGLLAWQWQQNQAAQDHYWHVMTPIQRARNIPIYNDDGTVSGFVPVPPEMRMFWASFVEGMGVTFGYLDPVGDQVNTGPMTAALNAMLNTAYQDVIPNPIGPGPAALFFAPAGVRPPDLAFGRFTAEAPRPPRDTSMEQSELEVRLRLAVEELFGASAAMMIDTYDTFNGATTHGYDTFEAATAAAQSFTGPWRQPSAAGPLAPIMGTDMRVSLVDPISQELFPRLEQSERMNVAFNREVRGPGRLRLNDPTPSPFALRNSRGTMLERVGDMNRGLQSWLRARYTTQMSTLRSRLEATRTNPQFADPQARVEEQNRIRMQMRRHNEEALEQFMSLEEEITQMLGSPFRFSDDNLDRLRSMPRNGSPGP